MQRRWFNFLAVVLVSITLFVGKTIDAKDEAVTINLMKSSVTLYPPFEITETLLYKDGGTIGIVVKDSQGISLPLCYDRRIKVPEEERFVYVGATYPDKSSAVQVKNGSATERVLLKVLQSAKIPDSPRIRADLVQTVVKKLAGKSRILMGR